MKRIIYFCLAFSSFIVGCEKDFLNKKPNKSHVVPTSLSDFEALLDNDITMNGSANSGWGPVPGLGEAGSDDYYLTQESFLSILIVQTQNYYTWKKDIYDSNDGYDWLDPYRCVFNSNVVLDGLGKIQRTPSNQMHYDRVKGAALFYRSHVFYQLAQVYCLPFQKGGGNDSPGLPLRLSADLAENLTRASLKETYDRMISDLERSLIFLPDVPAMKTRPSKQASYGLLARIYLIMQEYDKAKLYADSCLQIHHSLIDFNTINLNAAYPFAGGAHKNQEVIFACNMILKPTNMPFRPTFALIDTNLYNSYEDNDLRKKAFFTPNARGHSFKGSYEGNSFLFAGIAVDEIYLIRAECLLRLGELDEALKDVSLLRSNRMDNSKDYPKLNFYSNDEALEFVLTERRKELLFRGLRWTDLRRLNLEGRRITLKRIVNGQEYTLHPNDKRYTYPIPVQVMGYHPDWSPNER